MWSISFIRYSPQTAGSEITSQLVECYRDVFSDEPWNEWLKCPACQKYWGKKDREVLAKNKFEHCQTALVDYWPKEQVVSDIFHEITPTSSCWLAMTNNQVIGFCWGYPISCAELEKKLGVTFCAKIELEKNTRVAYQNELGVITAHRNSKIAKILVAKRLDDFLAQSLKFGIVRVRQYPAPSKTFLWYTQKLGYEIIAAYPNDDGRVILGRQLAGLDNFLTL